MKKDILILATAVLFLGVGVLRSQTAAAAKPPLQVLDEMKTSNAAIIEQQKKTLEVLDEMQKTADQLKTFSKRT